MKHAIPVRRFALAQVLTLAITIVSDVGAQQQPQSARDTQPHTCTCYELSYAPDTLSYYLPALVQLIDDAGATHGSRLSHVAGWRGGGVQRQDLRESFKLSSGTARWRQRGDSLFIEMDPVLRTFIIRLQRLDTAAARAASHARARPVSWRGRAFAYPADGPPYLEGDVFVSTVACDAFRTPR